MRYDAIFTPPYDPKAGTFNGETIYFVEIPKNAGGLMIWGYSVGSQYEEDWPLLRSLVGRNMYYAKCFSVACPDGEVGSVAMQYTFPIPKEEFELARTLQWDAEKWRMSV